MTRSLGEELRWLAEHDKSQLQNLLSQLTEEEAESIIYDWEGVWARPNQLVDDSWPESVILFMAGRGFGKALSYQEVIPTPYGFKFVKDVVVGDTLFDESGKPTTVKAVYDWPSKNTVEVIFDDKTAVKVCDEHLWSVFESPNDDFSDWSSSKVKKTSELAVGDIIPTCEPVQYQTKDLEMEPYLLGYWLGDGHSKENAITVGSSDQESVERLFQFSRYNWKKNVDKRNGVLKLTFSLKDCSKRRTYRGCSPGTLNSAGRRHIKKHGTDESKLGKWAFNKGQKDSTCSILNSIGVFKNKHIPKTYKESSIDQRIDLLRGLMDSDGYIDSRGLCELTSTNKRLALDFKELAESLGIKARLYTGNATIKGVTKSKKYRVSFYPKFNPFMLTRKADRWEKTIHRRREDTFCRKIKEVRGCSSVGAKCFTVDSKNSLFLASKHYIPTHNTRVGSELIRRKARNPENNMTIVAATTRDVIDTCVLGDSGIMGVCPPKEAPEYEPSKSRVVFPNGAVASLMSAESPERARGANRSIIWGDELGSWPDKDMFDQLMLSLRKGESKFYGTTTPRANDIIIHLYRHAVFNNDPSEKGKWVRIITGSTYDNIHNLSGAFRDTIVSTYEGTRLGRQELEGLLLLDAEGALWTTETIVKQTLNDGEEPPPLKRVCIGVDPAVSTGKNSDKTGLVVSGLGEDDKGYVLEDHTNKYSPEGWVNKVLSIYDHYSRFCATSVIVEKNQGGDFIQQSIERARPFLPVDYTFSSRSKIQRAEPIALMYEQGKIFHTKTFTDLETEMTNYEGAPRQKSPDHMDAMVFSIYGCMPLKNRVTKSFELLM